MRAIALSLVLSLTGCKFAVEHPAATIGFVGAGIGVATCEIGTGFDLGDGKTQLTCGAIAAGAGVALAGIVALAIYLGGDGHTVLVEDNETPPPIIRNTKAPDPAPSVEIKLPEEPWYRDKPEQYRVCSSEAEAVPASHFPSPFERCDPTSESFTSPPGGNELHFHYKNFSVAETTAERARTPNACCYLVYEFPRRDAAP